MLAPPIKSSTQVVWKPTSTAMSWKAVCKKPKNFKEFIDELKKMLNAKEKKKFDAVITLNGMDPANL